MVSRFSPGTTARRPCECVTGGGERSYIAGGIDINQQGPRFSGDSDNGENTKASSQSLSFAGESASRETVTFSARAGAGGQRTLP
ncbi:MAG: hypothetical protein ACREFJ_02620 [Acetobacteraceae bacterium]